MTAFTILFLQLLLNSAGLAQPGLCVLISWREDPDRILLSPPISQNSVETNDMKEGTVAVNCNTFVFVLFWFYVCFAEYPGPDEAFSR